MYKVRTELVQEGDLDTIEGLQSHELDAIYEKAYFISEKCFEAEDKEVPSFYGYCLIFSGEQQFGSAVVI